jgi:hypothetical protein
MKSEGQPTRRFVFEIFLLRVSNHQNILYFNHMHLPKRCAIGRATSELEHRNKEVAAGVNVVF